MTEVSLTRSTEGPAGEYGRVVSFLRDQLLTGQLKTGDLLLPERELAMRLNVSRPVVREALRALAMIGAVEIRHGVGTVVRRPDVATLGQFFTFFLAQQPDVVEDIMEARVAIEYHAIRLACARGEQSDFAKLNAAFERIEATINDPIEGGKADFAFHDAIVRAARSPSLASIYGAISDLMMRSHLGRREKIMKVEGIQTFLIDHHRLIMGAVLNRDATAGIDLLNQHFQIGADFNRRAMLQAAL